MKILYLCADPGIPLNGRKGCSTHVRETVYILQEMGHEVKVVCSNLEGDEQNVRPMDVTYIPPFTSKKWGFDLRRILLDRLMWRTVRQLIDQWKPDAIYERYSLYSRLGLWADRHYGLPRVTELNAFLTREQQDRIRWMWLARRMENTIVSRAQHVIVVSEPLRQEVHQLGVPLEAITKMPMAVDLEKFHPRHKEEGLLKEYNIEGRTIIGYVGTLAGWHGLKLLFGMAHKMKAQGAPPFCFLIVGGGGEKLERSLERCREEGLEDEFRYIGSVPHERVPYYLNAMDVAIIPDTTYWSSPSKLFEYMASGLPVLAPQYPAISEAMEDGKEGLIFQPGDVDQMAACALRMLSDPQMIQSMSANIRHRAEKERSWLRNGQGILNIYRKLGCAAAK